jgi:hypothetical protein
MSFPPATEMFQFAGFASRTYEFSSGYSLLSGLPHSEIQGSTIARISPWLIAACHVLRRLSVPRHPPDALTLRLIAKPVACRDKPLATESRMKTLKETVAQPPAFAADPAQFPNSLPLHPSKIIAGPGAGRARRIRKSPIAARLEVQLVEVNGIEPMTSCLQSRRSPN